ncbi:hypothetical protein CDES_05605 [Corynebacterium deserti GIMN1.010]|uniref:Uncharacterized protein n=1 Tax=Corynebacterium deserti GIMN1.010 TaxID=931089 RepID=A0A0M4CPE1_9CORY|nr:hypothetical protein [Corynebacterium deserti]ALC05555.1 hypothetical protein CDES_05605 [Corynebacterium deserti GIMN1.010]
MTEETKKQRFRRLAKSRGDRLLKEINLLGNLANKKNYEFDAADVEALFSAIEDELRETKSKFDPEIKSARRVEFDG